MRESQNDMLNKKMLTVLGASVFAFTAIACSGSETSSTASKPVAAAEATVEQGKSSAKSYVSAKTLAAGTFDGRSDHIVTGQVTVEKTTGGYQLRFADNFSLDNAPDPVVALGNGETFSVSNKLGVLKHKTGAQTYSLPANFTPGEFSEVYVWCEKFSVPLGVAKLTAK